ncbi:ABC transporter ATP-binding protein [Cellulomonas sp. SLBN-39]|uniref:ABC transporter ATP-binding protein n=1 Tax=Cellulomonas sp. SLBN-39 TaxID=2768446 RepID=UPI00117507C3|nr:ABC transporter ATP-binding protein [Cellulomonas sp. SLBN-39]TQL02259.1 ATP-binding cassette subfamily C protein [Cellulomonas sp. SLBN-39]
MTTTTSTTTHEPVAAHDAGGAPGRQRPGRPQVTVPKGAFRSFLHTMREHRTGLVLVGVVSVVATILGVAQPLMMQRMIDAASSGAENPWVWWLVGVTLGEGVLRGAQSFVLQRTGEAFVGGLRRSLIARVLRLPMAAYSATPKGEWISRLGADTSQVRTIVTSGLFELVSAVLMFGAAVVLMVTLDPVLFSLTLGGVVLGGVGITFMGARMRRTSEVTQAEVARMTSAADRALSSVVLIRASAATEQQVELVTRYARRAEASGVRMARIQAWVQPVMSLCIQGAFLLVLAVGGLRVASGVLTVGELMAFIMYLFLLVMPVTQAMSAYTQIQLGLASYDRIRQVLHMPAERTGGSTDVVGPTESEPAVVLEDVHFGYGDEPVLRGVSLTVPVGSRTAVVGPSGAGKSTVLALLEGFMDPDAGVVRSLGHDLRDVDLDSYRRHVAYVEQGAPALGGTLAGNLRLVRTDATDEDLRRVLGAVGLDGLIARQDAGLDLDLGDNGSVLSGGERQRLAWARVLLQDPQLLLFDEPTSSVDSATESLLGLALDEVSRGRTTVIVAHRLSTVVTADQIVVLENGRVLDVGTHTELVERCALYRTFAEHQLLV